MEQAPRRTSLKLALIGGSAVGKTSLVRRIMGQPVPVQHISTIAVDCRSCELPREGGVFARLMDGFRHT